MYIIHWPFKFGGEVKSMPVAKEMVLPLDLKSVWGGMEECKRLGLARGIGVSNFTCNMLQDLLSIAKIPPVLNQVCIYIYIYHYIIISFLILLCTYEHE